MCDLKPPKQVEIIFGIGRRFFTGVFGAMIALSVSIVLSSCAAKTTKKVHASTHPQSLPKPAAIRVAQDTSNKRKPPLLPKTIVNIKPENASDLASSAPLPPDDTKTVDSTTPKFINNEQPQDFFRGAGDAPVGETVLGSFFDSIFRPATPPNQPVSSTTYTVQ